MRGYYVAVMLLLLPPCLGAQVEVENIRASRAPAQSRIVFDLSAPVEHSLFTLADPQRVVVDMNNVRVRQTVPQPDPADRLLSRIRTAKRNGSDLRVVLDVKAPVRPQSFVLKPNGEYGHRLVIDLQALTQKGAPSPQVAKALDVSSGRLRDIVVALDAGHGGKDPGARGRKGTLEKDVVLSITRRLARLINDQRGMRAVLVRQGDEYLELRRRIEIAREADADVFISIHADAYHDPGISGSSVYALSNNGASSEAAKWLADRENSADRVGGVSIQDKDDLLVSVLLDLSQTATVSASIDVGASVLRELQRLGKPHKASVQRAGFVVLKSPDIPSILVETGFISNPSEERKLRTADHQRRLAKAMFRGLFGYLTVNPPPNTLLAARQHVIGKGDTLSDIAQRYQVPVDALRTLNNLSGDLIRVGTVLHIPDAHGT
nr:N-acetylmuramoyl-L-alanine amidase [Gammaproteobacteria bacterium]